LSLWITIREDVLSRFYLTTVTYTIEQYCHRWILRNQRPESPVFSGDYAFPLRDYPVWEILAVYLTHPTNESNPEKYRLIWLPPVWNWRPGT
jgi:hypothetical protein